ncbi:hypothetical protein ACSQ67_018494 [Phaseolus vulgaris]
MHINLLFLLLLFISTSYAATDTLPEGFSLSVEKKGDTLLSSNGDFSAGFFQVGENAFCFSVCFTRSKEPTVLWMANRDEPVNGKDSFLSLWKNGNLVLTDAGGTVIWETATLSSSKLHVKLRNDGNLLLLTSKGTIIWQSFDSPTDTLLPTQPLTERVGLVSSRSATNHSTGFYKLYYDNDNVLRLLYKGQTFSSVYWPPSWQLPINIGRSTYNITKTALLDSLGHFTSSDGFQFRSTDYPKKVYRRLKMDSDGNLRLYSFNEEHKMWEVTWQVVPQPCMIHGICGANSLCNHDPNIGRTCYCLKGFKIKDPNDWTQGCEPEFSSSDISCGSRESLGFLHVPTTELYGYDWNVTRVKSLKECQNICLSLCDKCVAVQLKFNEFSDYNCYPKTMAFNGRDSPNFDGELYLKLPNAILRSSTKILKHSPMNCSVGLSQKLNRFYQPPEKNSTLSFLVWFAFGVGVFELSTSFLVWFFLLRTSKHPDTKDQQHHLLSATGFQRFTYAELKSATKGFKEEVGRGAGGVVYKGTLENSGDIEQHRLVTWIREKIKHSPTCAFWMEEIIDPNLEGNCDVSEVEVLVKVALQCVEDDMNERPSMSQVAEMLQANQNKLLPR